MLYLEQFVVQTKQTIKLCNTMDRLELIRIKILGKNGSLNKQLNMLGTLPPEKRPMMGALINQAKRKIQAALNERKNTLEQTLFNAQLKTNKLDISLPGRRMENGGLHPVSRTIARIEYFFKGLGFSIETGPEIEDSYHNFDALNIPVHHPARAKHDTFWLDTIRLLRTQTSGVQIRTMQTKLPPIRIISSGRVYRNDYDKTHTPMFHQMEGLIIDTDISFSNLKGTLNDFLRNFFDYDIRIRFRPSYFPFTEPSAEVDVMNNNSSWVEVLGCGMVHPKILRNIGIDSEIYSSFAFGMGIERLTMLRYNVTDVRVFFENDLRFLKQFK